MSQSPPPASPHPSSNPRAVVPGSSPSPRPSIVHSSSSLSQSTGGGGSGTSAGSPSNAPSSAAPATAMPAETPSGSGNAGGMSSKIKAFAQAMGAGHHQEAWKRPTNVTGTGATHVRSFHCRMATEGLEFLDKQINEWLDSHPDYEVKNISIAVGEWSGKVKEANLIVQVWV